ncbi:MAG TPA: C40 family peptidase [Mycobacteriales bacterium]|nr:C40 family peptidase [Mycobacteriales bacterium]
MTSASIARRITVALLAAALTATVVGVDSPATASGSNPPDTLVVLAGSARYLVYADYPTDRSGPDYSDGALHVQSKSGAKGNLGVGWNPHDPDSVDADRFSLVGAELTAYSTAQARRVRWWDLQARTSGSARLPKGAAWQGSAPGGWVLVDANGTSVSVQANDGDLTTWGTPLPVEAAASGEVQALSGPTGVVTVGSTTETMAFQPWTDPTDITPLDPGLGGAPITAGDLTCDSVSASIAACRTPVASGPDHVDYRAVPLNGSQPSTPTESCDAPGVAIKTRIAFTCPSSPARIRFASIGAVTRSDVRVSAAPAVRAFGAYVTSTPTQAALVQVRSPRAPATVLVRSAGPLVREDVTGLLAAAKAVQARALGSGALSAPVRSHSPAAVLLASDNALIAAAIARDPSRKPRDTRALMGPVPRHLAHRPRRHPAHRRVTGSLSLSPFVRAVPDKGAAGYGVHRTHGGAWPVPFQHADGVYVDPTLGHAPSPTVSMVALRTALAALGQPYVWAAAGPRTFDCSGLVKWAYAHAGRRFTHYSGDQYNEARRIPPRDILPGDLILFEHLIGRREVIHHVAIYLGAGWMLNAPYTGQYVNVVPVESHVAGVVRP